MGEASDSRRAASLTRCVSDIRGQLRKLSGRDDWIETLPKRGYRWKGPVTEAAPAEITTEPGTPADIPAPTHRGRRVLRLAGRGAGYVVALLVMASAIIWLIDRFSSERPAIVAVLPVTADPASATAAAEFDRALMACLAEIGTVRVLARSAVESRPANPFPFFYYEFGARWVIETGLHDSAGQTLISIGVVDARTGIVEMQISEAVATGRSGEELLSEHARKELREFIELQLAR